MDVFAVTMWLTCQDDDPDILKAFDARWPASLQRAWALMVLAAKDTDDLAVALNDIVYKSCGKQMGSDLKLIAGVDFDGVDAFSGSDWHPGSGGLHESNPVDIKATLAGHTVKNDWTFPADNKKIGFMSAACEWKLVKVITP